MAYILVIINQPQNTTKVFIQKIKKIAEGYIFKHKMLPIDFDLYESEIQIVAKTAQEEFSCENLIGLVGLIPICFVFPDSAQKFKEIHSIFIKKNGENVIKIKLRKSAKSYNGFVFYDIVSSENFNRNYALKINDWVVFLLKNRLQKQFKQKHPPQSIIHLNDFYEYPRLVYVVSYHVHNQPFAFPIDAIAILPNEKVFVSLRKSSRANEVLQQSKQFNLSGVPFKEYHHVYSLGNSVESKENTTIFQDFEGEIYPHFATDVRFLKIENFIDMGKHWCYICHCQTHKIINLSGRLAHVPWYKI